MEEPRIEDVLRRLEDRLENLSSRLERLESGTLPTRPPEPPPVRQEPQRQATSYTYTPKLREPYKPPRWPSVPQERKPLSIDTEYLIGAKLLPKVGALLTLLGIVLLVIWGYSKGLVTPAMMFGAEVLFCTGFVAIGIVKRDLKEEYGQILTGLGSCGLYATFAGGHLYYHLYSGEALVAFFLALSLANLAFSLWRSFKPFLVLGLMGGLVTACVLPNMQQHENPTLNAALHFIVLIPAALIVARNRWMDMAAALWVASTVALGPILLSDLPWFDKSAILYLSTAVCLAAYGWSFSRTEQDGHGAFIPFALWVSGFIGFIVNYDPSGAWQYLGFAVLFGAVGMALSRKPFVRDRFLMAAIGVPMTIAPFCFPLPQPTGIFAVLSILAALVSWVKFPKWASGAAALEFVLAAVTFYNTSFNPADWRTESVLLVLLIASAILAGRALTRAWQRAEMFTLTAVGLCVLLFSRLSLVFLGLPQVHARPELSITLVLIAFTYYCVQLYFRTKWVNAGLAFSLLFLMSLVGYSMIAVGLMPGIDLALLLPLIGVPLLATRTAQEDQKLAINSVVTIIVGGLFTRLCLVLGRWFLHPPYPVQLTIYAALVFAIGCFIALRYTRNKALAVGGWVLFSFAACVYLFGATLPLWVDISLISGLFGTFVLGARNTASIVVADRKDYNLGIALLGWAAFTRWAWVAMAYMAPSVGSSPSITIAWIAYAVGLIVLGFRYKAIEFRYVSFAVMGGTVVKIMLYDLATTEWGVRVGITIALGLVMLAGGYWYLAREQQARKPSA
ncbi:MAG: hypothetical protein QOJ65_871 [Fimbriimonadaceae bacterium]|jgi:uncharacterized membrane protein|nr:hypothetical protein [Fimbriimonadaceae bacterium]